VSAPFEPPSREVDFAASDVADTSVSAKGAPRRIAAFVLAAIVAASSVVFALGRPNARNVERQITALAAELDGFKKTTGAYPNDLATLGWRLPPLQRNGGLVDPWGRAFVYKATDGGKRYELRSLAADGVPSGDDVVRAPAQ